MLTYCCVRLAFESNRRLALVQNLTVLKPIRVFFMEQWRIGGILILDFGIGIAYWKY